MNFKIFTLGLLFFITTQINAQSYSGFLADNYNGVHGVLQNPANIADSRLKLDLNLFGISTFFGNNYLGIRLDDAFSNVGSVFDTAEQTPKRDNFLSANLDILGPSIMLGINKKSAVALFTRGRFFFNADDIDGTLLDKEGGFDEEQAFSIQEDKVAAAINLWTEIGATYSRVLWHKDQNFLKGGLSAKYIMGIHHAYIKGDGINVGFDPQTGEISTAGQLIYGNDVSNDEGNSINFFQGSDSKGFGVDLGLVYEWRPNYSKFSSSSIDGTTVVDKSLNKYKVKFGLSITDMGKINNNKGEQSTYDLNKIQDGNNFDGLELEEALQQNFVQEGGLQPSAKTSLPTALHMNADWNINSTFYLNFNTDISLVSDTKINTNHIVNTYSISPRLERRWYSIYSPFSLVQGVGLQWGTGFRAGPLYLGSGSILTTLLGQTTRSLDFYTGIKVPLYHSRQKDKDQDGLFDSIDDCPRVAGPRENNGCPWKDSDNDSVLDKDDPCPDTVGPAGNHGCPWPDTDEDGILDKDDNCPNEPGTVENQGCPWKDSDKDGVFDKDDQCPETPGIKEFNGCPDTDTDGLMDTEDRCPTTPGKKEELIDAMKRL